MATTLIYSDKETLAYELISAGKSLGGEVVAVAINNEELAKGLSSRGVKTLSINEPALTLADPAALASALRQAAEKAGASTVLVSSNRRLKEVAGRLAQMRDGACLTDINSLAMKGGKLVGTRNALGGATVATYTAEPQGAVVALTAKAFEAAGESSGGGIENLSVDVKPTVKLVEVKPKAGDSVNIETAEVLVAVGQGLGSQQDLPMIEELARTLGGVVGCSKPVATDRKWLSEERIIGLSGKKCKPGLAIVLGVSGQVQFVVGIRDARTIVAVNTDENASIATMSDYFLVGDLNQVVPALTRALS